MKNNYFITLRDNGEQYGPFPTKQWKFMHKALKINEEQGREFTGKDFPELSSKNFRQKIFLLKNYIENEIPYSYPKWYKIKGVNLHYAHRKKTSGSIIGNNVVTLLDKLPESCYVINNLEIQFNSGEELYNVMVNMGVEFNSKKEILWEDCKHGIKIIVKIDEKAVNTKLTCEKIPIVYDMIGILRITEILGMISDRINQITHNIITIPSVNNWICISYSLGDNNQYLFNQSEFHRSWKDIAGGFMRKYSIQTKDNLYSSYK
jgi:hypothetical protein